MKPIATRECHVVAKVLLWFTNREWATYRVNCEGNGFVFNVPLRIEELWITPLSIEEYMAIIRSVDTLHTIKWVIWTLH
ncbi:hypothetical protein BLOT_000774 [Blomia tropicalis]|nr:hypothetical protein BLOT_000774 [Blomia tropicalis]